MSHVHGLALRLQTIQAPLQACRLCFRKLSDKCLRSSFELIFEQFRLRFRAVRTEQLINPVEFYLSEWHAVGESAVKNPASTAD